MKPNNEELLSAWLRVSTSIVNSRLVSDLPYNEALVCNVLYQNSCQKNSQLLTATDLCNKTNMLKSQMNRTLNLLEEKNLIKRQRSESDKRQVYIYFNIDDAQIYKMQHEKVLSLIDEIIVQFGDGKTKAVIDALTDVADIADTIINEKMPEE